ncbi:hypothetical protein RIR_jg25500.t1 [Rhizophagus irregularis DAOM 181602=DAOM 197198]|nr:hypothetical protein RIR_jg25500.t1 [Rhizophagus irregularis DAOM 181602=DAOM 197198]
MFSLFLFTCILILTILTILTTCLFFPFSLFLYFFVQLLCRYRNIYLLILIILILTHFFYLFVTLCSRPQLRYRAIVKILRDLIG